MPTANSLADHLSANRLLANRFSVDRRPADACPKVVKFVNIATNLKTKDLQLVPPSKHNIIDKNGAQKANPSQEIPAVLATRGDGESHASSTLETLFTKSPMPRGSRGRLAPGINNFRGDLTPSNGFSRKEERTHQSRKETRPLTGFKLTASSPTGLEGLYNCGSRLRPLFGWPLAEGSGGGCEVISRSWADWARVR